MPDINILVVDDEKEIADLIEIYLVSDGYKVFKAENAEAGLSILDKQDIHLVLMLDTYDAWYERTGDVQKDPGDKQYSHYHAQC